MPKTDTILSAKSLRYFLQLVDTMNYTQAAQILGITQPALTQQIKKLERTIGAPLFGQMGKKLYLTEAGKEMKVAASQLLDTINSVVNNIQEFTQSDKGTITIGVLETLDITILRQFLTKFAEKYPNISINVYDFDYEDLWRELDKNMIDMAVMYLPDNTKRDEINLHHQYEHQLIYHDRLVVLTHKNTVEANKEYPISRFLKRKWISYPQNYYLTNLMKNYFGSKRKPNVFLTLPRPKYLIDAAENTKMDTFVSREYYVTHKNETTLTPVYIQNDKEFDISLVYLNDKTNIPRIQNFLKEWNIFLDKKDYSSRLEEEKKIQ